MEETMRSHPLGSTFPSQLRALPIRVRDLIQRNSRLPRFSRSLPDSTPAARALPCPVPQEEQFAILWMDRLPPLSRLRIIHLFQLPEIWYSKLVFLNRTNCLALF